MPANCELQSRAAKFPHLADVEYDPTGSRIVTRTDRGAPRLWRSDGQLERVLPIDYCNASTSIAWSPDGRVLACSEFRWLRLFDGSSGAELAHESFVECPATVESVAFDPSGRWLAVGDIDEGLHVWNAHTLQHVRTILGVRGLGIDHHRPIVALAFSIDGRWLAYAKSDPCMTTVEVVDVESGSSVAIADPDQPRWCEKLRLEWDRSGERMWASLGRGGVPAWRIDVADQRMTRVDTLGWPSKVAIDNIIAFGSGHGTICLDTSLGNMCWSEPHTSSTRFILQASSGHMSGSIDSLDGLRVVIGVNGERQRRFADVARYMYDPKRVRAACDGVRLETLEL